MIDDYVQVNRDLWNSEAPYWATVGERLWSLETPVWGNWGVSNDVVQLLPEDMAEHDAVELGCGTGYVSAWMRRKGATVTAIDIAAEQLSSARRFAQSHQLDISFIEGNAETTGFADASFDFAISEYGASIWCKPEAWLREAWRILRPGGRLVFLGNHPLVLICSPKDGSPCEMVLHRPYRDMWGADWTQVAFEPSGICFNLTVSGWVALFRDIGFQVEDYRELYAPDHVTDTRAAVPADWAKSYPVEQVWFLNKP